MFCNKTRDSNEGVNIYLSTYGVMLCLNFKLNTDAKTLHLGFHQQAYKDFLIRLVLNLAS